MNSKLAYPLAKVIARIYMVGALVLSYMHIVHLFQMLGLTGWESYVAPAFLDGFAILGWICRGEQFSASTRKIGFRLQLGAGILSLAANVLSADSAGGMIFGVLVVIGFVLSEWISDRLRSAKDDADAATAARRSAAAAKAAATRKANAAAKTPAPRKARTAKTARPALAPVASIA